MTQENFDKLKNRTNNNLIPFSKELWETGEYEAVVETVNATIIYEITEYYVFGRIANTPVSWDLSGYNRDARYTLMLRKKTKKVWVPIYEGNCYENKEECDKYNSVHSRFIKAIEVEI